MAEQIVQLKTLVASLETTARDKDQYIQLLKSQSKVTEETSPATTTSFNNAHNNHPSGYEHSGIQFVDRLKYLEDRYLDNRRHNLDISLAKLSHNQPNSSEVEMQKLVWKIDQLLQSSNRCGKTHACFCSDLEKRLQYIYK